MTASAKATAMAASTAFPPCLSIAIPISVAWLSAFLERYEQAMRGNSAAFASRLDRGWVPPTVEDQQAVIEDDEDIRRRDI